MQPTDQPRRRVLIYGDPEQVAGGCLPLLREHADVRAVSSMAEAEAALREESFDVVLAPSSELLPLTSRAGRDQARLILDAIAQGVCSIGRDGQIIWANTALRAYPPDVIEAVRAACEDLMREMLTDPARRPQRRELTVGQKYVFDLNASALPDASGGLDRVVGLVYDTTTLSRMRAKLDAIDAAGRELVALEGDASARLEVAERLKLLEDKLIRYCRDLLDFTHFNVLVLDPQTNRLETVLAGGFSEQAKSVNIYATREGNGISGYVAATGQAYICPDVHADPRYLSGYEQARSSLTVPLRLNDRIVGVLNVESDEPAAFTDEDRQVAEIFGRYIAVALQTLKLLIVERSETSGQLAADVRAQAAEPLNDIVTEAAYLLQSAGSEDARRRLRTVIDRVDQVKAVLQEVAEVPAIRGLRAGGRDVNPALQGKRILVADDEDIIRQTISDVLAKCGALPVMAKDGDEAVAILGAQRFDLVLSDIKMPHKNGYEVFAAVKQADPHCPVVLITGFGYDPEHSIIRASREGLAGVLFKPFKVEQLLEMIEKAVTA